MRLLHEVRHAEAHTAIAEILESRRDREVRWLFVQQEDIAVRDVARGWGGLDVGRAAWSAVGGHGERGSIEGIAGCFQAGREPVQVCDACAAAGDIEINHEEKCVAGGGDAACRNGGGVGGFCCAIVKRRCLDCLEGCLPGAGTDLPAGVMASVPYATLNVVPTAGEKPSGVCATINRSNVAARARVEKCISETITNVWE
jgi:hypothetical protein